MAGDDLNIALIIKAIDFATAPIKKITRNFEALRKSKQRADKAFKQAANLRQAAEGMNAFSRAARGALAKPISEFEDFQFAMSNVKALSGATTEEFSSLTKQAKDLGASTKFTATQAAEGLGMLAMAGFNAKESIDALPATLNLATAANADLGRTADIASNIMGGFNIPANEMTRVADVITKTFTSSNTTLESLAETMSYAAPVAESFGVSMEQTAAMAGLLGNAGIKGSRAGTALNAVMLRLAAPAKMGKDAMEKLGLQVEEFNVAASDATKRELGLSFKDSAGDMRNLTDILHDVSVATEEMGVVKRGDILQKLFGKIALPAVLKLLKNVGSGEIRSFTTAIENSTGTVDRISKVMMDNAKGATVQMDSALSGLYTTIGESLEPSLTSIKETITDIVRGMNSFAKENPTLTKVLFLTAGVVTVLATAVTGLTFALAAASTASGVMSLGYGTLQTVMAITSGFISTQIVRIQLWGLAIWTKAIPAMGAWIVKMWAAVPAAAAASLPIIAVAAAIGAVTLAIIQLVKHWDELDFVEGFKGITESIGESGILSTLGELFDPRTLIKDMGLMGDGSNDVGGIGPNGALGTTSIPTDGITGQQSQGRPLDGKGKIVVEFRNGVPVVAEQETSGGLSVETDTGALMPVGAQ